MKTRAERLNHDRRVKAKTMRKAKALGIKDITPKWVGRTASVHWTCACFMCTKNYSRPEFEKANPAAVFNY